PEMALQFKDSFWSAEFISNTGYEALTQRLNDGRRTCKDLEDLLKMRASAEEKYGKELVAIAHKAGGLFEIRWVNYTWLKIENVGKQHMHLAVELREEVKRMEQFRERQKEQRRKFECVVEKLQKTKVSLYKKTIDVSRSNLLFHFHFYSVSRSVCQKKLYSANVEQLDKIRQDWESSYICTCEMFQQQEEDRVNILRNAMWVHSNHLSSLCVKDDECYENMRIVLEKCDAVEDNNCFVEMKSTGSAPPAVKLFYSHGVILFGAGVTEVLVLLSLGFVFFFCLFLLSFSFFFFLVETPHAAVHTRSRQCQCCSLCSCCFQGDDELSVFAGDTVLVTLRGDDGWWTVQCNGHSGLVPGSYLSPDSSTLHAEQ
uniref:SH3 domain-containing protein n=1 Tax=Periophthalmus magnuspinnatus TaxID=409849 RepID=A0A3B3ZUH0_9GOBI